MAPREESEIAGDEAEAWRQARLQFLPWERTPADIDSPAQRALKQRLVQHAGAEIAASAYIAAEAGIQFGLEDEFAARNRIPAFPGMTPHLGALPPPKSAAGRRS
jgi:hypothetical protein